MSTPDLTRHEPPAGRFGVTDNVALARFLLKIARTAGVARQPLLREARIPHWALTADSGMIASRHTIRLWEVSADALDDPGLGARFAQRLRTGDLALLEYLFVTAATLQAGLTAVSDHFWLITTNGQLTLTPDNSGALTCRYHHVDDSDPALRLADQFAVTTLCEWARRATGTPVIPARATFGYQPAAAQRALADALATRAIDFGTPMTTVTFSPAQLAQPLRTADPVLAAILNQFAAGLPRPGPVTWFGQFQRELSAALSNGTPSLSCVAAALTLSPRSLQRHLAEHNTTWRAELDAARRQRAERALGHKQSQAELTRLLAYSDPRSARRAQRRWERLAR